VSAIALALRQVRYTNRAFWRNPASAFFTFVFPLMFLVIFTALLGSGRVEVAPGLFIDQARYYVAAMTTFAVISACYTNVAVSVTFQRDAGILKRVRGTPLPGWAYLAGRVIHAILVSLLLVALTSAFGGLFYGAGVPTGSLLARFLLVLVVGSASFCALGLATTSAVPNADAGPPIVNAIILPLLFLSGIFIPIGADAPAWIRFVGSAFPVRHFADAVIAGFYGAPFAFEWHDVAVVAAWGIAGLLVAVRAFSWEPRR
jgi:ABC-2 type transport system permease protein